MQCLTMCLLNDNIILDFDPHTKEVHVMNNIMTFLFSPNGFVPYLVTYFVYIAAIVIAFFIGFALRKNKNKKELESNKTGLEESGSGAETKTA